MLFNLLINIVYWKNWYGKITKIKYNLNCSTETPDLADLQHCQLYVITEKADSWLRDTTDITYFQ